MPPAALCPSRGHRSGVCPSPPGKRQHRRAAAPRARVSRRSPVTHADVRGVCPRGRWQRHPVARQLHPRGTHCPRSGIAGANSEVPKPGLGLAQSLPSLVSGLIPSVPPWTATAGLSAQTRQWKEEEEEDEEEGSW